jgi:hypothetical protein
MLGMTEERQSRSALAIAILLSVAIAALPFLLIGLALIEGLFFGTEGCIAVYRAIGIDPLLRGLAGWLYAQLGYA